MKKKPHRLFTKLKPVNVCVLFYPPFSVFSWWCLPHLAIVHLLIKNGLLYFNACQPCNDWVHTLCNNELETKQQAACGGTHREITILQNFIRRFAVIICQRTVGALNYCRHCSTLTHQKGEGPRVSVSVQLIPEPPKASNISHLHNSHDFALPANTSNRWPRFANAG